MNNLTKSFSFTFAFTLIFFAFLCFNVVQTKAQEAQKTFYENPQLTLEEVMEQYHEHMNDTFNMYIKKMLKATEKNPNDPNGKPLENAEACLQNPDNFSTFCVAARLLGNSDLPQDQGYLSYKKALILRRSEIFDSGKEKNEALQAGELTWDTMTTVSNVIARQKSIEREINTAKQTLDRTLAAYDELYHAWPMHKKYTQIFADLTVYRDKLVELRSQTDEFPSRFIDVTTTQCL